MASKYRLLHIVFILLFSFAAFNAVAQPTLPDIAGAADKGIVILSWNCQYNGVKSIAVLRSIDSVFNYAPIGKVKKTDKGIQAFVDGHPTGGTNYYKLVVLFSSGLTWTSNHCNVFVAPSDAAPVRLPSNDSIQRYLVTIDTAKVKKINTVAVPVIKPVVKDNLSVEPEDAEDEPKQKTKTPPNPDDDEDAESNAKPAEPKHRVFISFDMDTIANASANNHHQQGTPQVQHKVVTMSFDDPTETTTTFIRSLYVFTDPVTGHVNMNLPEDVATHHYSIKFYNDKNELVIEVPKLNSSKIILDKRNFQRSGTYKFVLRKDILELEQGYIVIP